MSRRAERSPYDRVRVPKALWKAWRHVRSKGVRSVSRETRIEIAEFDRAAETTIRSMSRRLQLRTFEFQPATGVTKKRPGKTGRPIVIATVESRVVQRSLLDTLYEIPGLKPYLTIPTSFGMRGVPPAIEKAYRLVIEGAGGYYLRSDIAGFFAEMPRGLPLARIAELVDDEDFNRLLAEATEVDLVNAAGLGADVALFPDDATGVAQGCALSTLLGDVLLREFDEEMNGRGVACLRYVDDFLLLGPSRSAVRKAFAKAQDLLGKLGLRAYDPARDTDKAAEGLTNRKWEFLGCEIVPGIIRPSAKSKRGLLTKIDRALTEGSAGFADPRSVRPKGVSLVETLTDVDRLVTGWGNQYQFCNDAQGFEALDDQIQRRVDSHIASARMVMSRQEGREADRNRRRLLGIHVLADSNHNPIAGRVHRERN